MSEPASHPAPPLRTWRPMAAWTGAILLALGLAWFVGAVVVPVWQVRAAVMRCYDRRALLARALVDEVDVLGGPDEAAQKLGLYLRVPGPLAPHRMIATRMLGECGRCAVPALKSLLDDEDKTVRYWAAWELGNVGAAAEETAPALTRALADGDGDVRQAAAEALRKIRREDEFAKPSMELQRRLAVFVGSGEPADVVKWAEQYHGEAPGHQMMIDFVIWGNRNPQRMKLLLSKWPTTSRDKLVESLSWAASDSGQAVLFEMPEKPGRSGKAIPK